jgi:hypothetical protein
MIPREGPLRTTEPARAGRRLNVDPVACDDVAAGAKRRGRLAKAGPLEFALDGPEPTTTARDLDAPLTHLGVDPCGQF